MRFLCRFILALMFGLFLPGCGEEELAEIDGLEQSYLMGGKRFDGKVAKVEKWTVFAEPQMPGGWDFGFRSVDTFDLSGRLLERRVWKRGKPHEHLVVGRDTSGRLARLDYRVDRGEVGHVVDFEYDGWTVTVLRTSADGIVTDKEVRKYSENGEIDALSRINFPHRNRDVGKEVERWEEGNCGTSGDTSFWCVRRNGVLKRKESNVNGRKVKVVGYVENGDIDYWEEEKLIPDSVGSVWETRDPEFGVTFRSSSVPRQTGDTVELQIWERFPPDGSNESVQKRHLGKQGEVLLEEYFEWDPLSEVMKLKSVMKDILHRDPRGNLSVALTFEGKACRDVTVFKYEYR